MATTKRSKKEPQVPDATRIEAFIDMFEAVGTAKRTEGGMGLELQVDQQRMLAGETGLPYLAVALMYGDHFVTVEEISNYQRWKGRGLFERLLAEREAAAATEEG
jgi:hypothetical protein